ncbi:MAG: peptidylprolyl isomerase [Gemmatimonadota bacterium]
MRTWRQVVLAASVLWAGAASAQDSVAVRDTTGWQGELPVDRVVGIVGKTPILWSDVLIAVQARLRGQRPAMDAGQQRQFALDAINQLLNDEVFVQKAKTDTTIKVTDADVHDQVDQAFKRVRDQFRSEGEFREALKREAFASTDDYRKKLFEDAKRQETQLKLFQKLKSDGRLLPAVVNDAELTEAFDRQRANLPRKPATVAFRQLAVAPQPKPSARDSALRKAARLAQEIDAGTPFETVAKRESEDEGSRDVGGDLGWNRRGRMVPEFDRVMFQLNPGITSFPVETVFGFHLIRVDRVQPGEVKARHVLIRPKIDSADVALAMARADSAYARWVAGSPFDSLVTAFHDNSEDRGSIQPFEREQLPPSYQQALAGKAKGDITPPFAVPDRRGIPKFFILQVISASDAGEYTMDEVKDRLREQLSQEKSIGRLLERLKKEIYVAVLLGPELPTPIF